MPNKLIIFSAPSGSGKTTIVTQLMKSFPNLGFSISATTRQARQGKEVHGEDYYFLTEADFNSKKEKGEFVEWEEVYEGVSYGTLKSEIERLWKEGKDVLFDVDVKGGIKLKEFYGDAALSIFIKAPSIEDIKERLINRGTETKDSIEKRVDKINYELTFEDSFDVSVLNDTISSAVEESSKLIKEFLEKKYA